MVSKSLQNRLDKLYEALSIHDEPRAVLLGTKDDPIIVRGREYSYEEFRKVYPHTRLVVVGMLKQTAQWEREREMKRAKLIEIASEKDNYDK